MCYHISSSKADYRQMESQFDRTLRHPGTYEAFYHLTGFAHPQVQGLPMNRNHIVPMTWGIVEPGTKEIQEYWKREGDRTLNTRSEHVFHDARTSTAIRERRCIVPVTGFFEPRHKNGRSFPFYVHEPNTTYFGLLGCFQEFDHSLLFTILTGPANEFMAEIDNHNKRMPLICSSTLYENWLDPNLDDRQIKDIMSTGTGQAIMAYRVMEDVTDPKVDTNMKRAIEPVETPTCIACSRISDP